MPREHIRYYSPQDDWYATSSSYKSAKSASIVKPVVAIFSSTALALFGGLNFIPEPKPVKAENPIRRIEKAVGSDILTPEVRKEVPILDDSSRVQGEIRNSPQFASVVETRKEELEKSMTRFEEQCRTIDTRTESFLSFDKTIEEARLVNTLMLKDLEEVFRIGSGDLKADLANYKVALEVAPIRYRELAAESYRLAKEQKDPEYAEFYENNARTNENFAIHDEKRHELFFGPGTDAIANVIANRVDTYQSLYKLHVVWKKTLDNWPSTLDSPALGGYLAGIEKHMQYLRRFNESMKQLNDALEKEHRLPLDNSKPEPQPQPEPEPAPAPKTTAVQVRTVSVQSKTKRRQGSNQQPPQAVSPAPQAVAPAPAPAPTYYRHQYYELVNGQWVLRETLVPAP